MNTLVKAFATLTLLAIMTLVGVYLEVYNEAIAPVVFAVAGIRWLKARLSEDWGL